MAKTAKGEQAVMEPLLAEGKVVDVRDISMHLLVSPPFQLRADGQDLDRLVASLRQDGQLEALKVRALPGPEGEFEVLCGNRRRAAAAVLKWKTLRAEIVAVDDTAAFRLAITDNMQRVDFSPLEEAHTFQWGVSAGWSNAQIALAAGRSEQFVAGRLALLELSKPVREALEGEMIRPSQAMAVEAVAQIGKADEVFLQLADGDGTASNLQVSEAVDDVFARNTVPLDRSTAFEWKEECQKHGCLGANLEGKPVCTEPEHWVLATVAAAKPDLDAALELLAKKAKNLGLPSGEKGDLALPVFYDLGAFMPYGRSSEALRSVNVPDHARVPFRVGPDYSGDQGREWADMRVGDRTDCKSCPAWKKGKGKGRMIVVTARRGLGLTPDAAVVCAGETCREKKEADNLGAAEVKKQKAERENRAAQAKLNREAIAGARELAKNPRKVLAALLVTRMKTGEPVQFNTWRFLHEFTVQGQRVPPNGEQLLAKLMALGQEKLIELLAFHVVASTDSALGVDGFTPRSLAATLSAFLGEKTATRLREESQEAPEKPKRKRPAKKSGAS